MKAGILQIDRDLLRDLLKLPRSTRIVDISCEREIMGGPLRLVLEDESLPVVPTGQLIPVINVEYENMQFVCYR